MYICLYICMLIHIYIFSISRSFRIYVDPSRSVPLSSFYTPLYVCLSMSLFVTLVVFIVLALSVCFIFLPLSPYLSIGFACVCVCCLLPFELVGRPY